MGRFPEAITEAKTAIALDPLSVATNVTLAGALLMARRYDDAILQYEKVVQADAGFAAAYRGIGAAHTYRKKYDLALTAFQRAARALPAASESQELKADIGYALAAAGRRSEALEIAQELTERAERAGEHVAGSVAAVHAGLGDVQTALDWLTRAFGVRDPEVGYLKVDPRWDALRADSRFIALLARLGLND
jgi:serine/threonine-protein kinase